MNSIFKEWERVVPEARKYSGGHRYDHKVSFWRSNSNGRKLLVMNISKDLIDEAGKSKFSLYKKGGIFALVPNHLGEYEKKPKSCRMNGATNQVCEGILNELGYIPEDVNNLQIDAVCLDGVIFFPYERIMEDEI